ncbi:hypothetical protein BN440_0739 [Erwinia amylovora MR1]|nr:hypothetical protein BN440_0739 [Erwinia amylovora MR1]
MQSLWRWLHTILLLLLQLNIASGDPFTRCGTGWFPYKSLF